MTRKRVRVRQVSVTSANRLQVPVPDSRTVTAANTGGCNRATIYVPCGIRDAIIMPRPNLNFLAVWHGGPANGVYCPDSSCPYLTAPFAVWAEPVVVEKGCGSIERLSRFEKKNCLGTVPKGSQRAMIAIDRCFNVNHFFLKKKMDCGFLCHPTLQPLYYKQLGRPRGRLGE